MATLITTTALAVTIAGAAPSASAAQAARDWPEKTECLPARGPDQTAARAAATPEVLSREELLRQDPEIRFIIEERGFSHLSDSTYRALAQGLSDQAAQETVDQPPAEPHGAPLPTTAPPLPAPADVGGQRLAEIPACGPAVAAWLLYSVWRVTVCTAISLSTTPLGGAVCRIITKYAGKLIPWNELCQARSAPTGPEGREVGRPGHVEAPVSRVA
ncbi:hypothetical protein LZG04_27480 [Saccharothrix sp. S26]|uniref:hypothetical protein n=1 Tax=Saccharothrix sp. S26 TaxID=2907215 RepID=UPI001F3F844D|nr:hypothetical protein [Saccharothrix sp. S26]MCE6998515.1 hypothetical protein [Saccharothrix sp. S26]